MKKVMIEDFLKVMKDTIHRFNKSNKSQDKIKKQKGKRTSFVPQSTN